MPPATPKKLVHWDTNSPSISTLNSPLFNETFDSSTDATSSFEFINSQLVAHGYVSSPGLLLAGISNEDSTRLAKCLLAMLSQRADDMSRTEDLTAKLRTLSYEHERLSSKYLTSNEKTANAEREMNLHKSRQAAALKNLQASEAAHKQTSAELQRTRTVLQGIRATHIAELKRKEKEVERTLEKWQRLADAQTRISSASVGLRCANSAIIEGIETVGRGQGFLDIALEQAEQARGHLSDENLLLRKLLLRAVNGIQNILYQVKCIAAGEESVDEPTPMTLSTLFPLAPPDMASDKLRSVLEDLKSSLSALACTTPSAPDSSATKATSQISAEEVERLQNIISNLKEELALSQKQCLENVANTQAMFDKFAEDHRVATSDIGDMSIELMTAPLKDEEKERLDKLRKELDMERQNFTDAAIRFGKEKAALQAERLEFFHEKRAWQVGVMLADLPPTPVPASPMRPSTSALTLPPHKSPHKSPRRAIHKVSHSSPRKSPAKNVCVGKAGNSGRKVHRVCRRSLASPCKPTLSYETEYIPPLPAPSFTFTAPTTAPLLVPSISGSLLPTSFVLPPPSPRASLPTKPALPIQSTEPLKPPSLEPPNTTPTYTPDASPPLSAAEIKEPTTPPAAKRQFPVAKPFALRMAHAYSPAKPSPLSRILMLAESPLTPPGGLNPDASLSPTSGPLEAVTEEDEDDGGLGYITNALNYQKHAPRPTDRMSATELGMDSPPDTPLQEKKVASANVVAAPLLPLLGGRGKVFHPEPAKRPPSTAEKGKARAVEPAARARVGEKENTSAKGRTVAGGGRPGKPLPADAKSVPRKMGSTAASGGKAVAKASVVNTASGPVASMSTATSRARPVVKPGAPPGGPRRVLINSADAPPIVKGRRG